MSVRDVTVEPIGPCNVCGQEQLLRTQVVVESGPGIRIAIRQLIECGCGSRPLEPSQRDARQDREAED